MKPGLRRHAAILLLLTVSIGGAQPLHAQDEDLDGLFEQAFGSRPEAQRVLIEVLTPGNPPGEIPAQVTPTGRLIAVSAQEFIAYMQDRLTAEAVSIVQSLQDDEELIAVESLETEGIAVDYDASSVRARIAVPPQLSTVLRLDLAPATSERSYTIPDATIQPARVSGGIGIRTSVYAPFGAQRDGWSLSTGLEPFLSFRWGTFQGGLTLETRASGPGLTREPAFFRTYALDGQTLLRAGDLSPEGNRYQSRASLLGVSLRRDRLQDGVAGDPLASVVLEREEQLVITVNNEPVFQQQVPAGRYDIAQAPVTRGLNRVEVSTPDSEAAPVTVWLPYESGLVAAGDHDFFHALGIREGSDYALSDLRFTSMHRYGFRESVTGGLGAQFSTDVQQASTHLTAAMPFGALSAEMALSTSDIAGAGFAFDFGYSLFQPSRPSKPSLRAAVSWAGDSFTNPDRPAGGNPFPLSFSASYARLLSGFTVNTTGQLSHAPNTGDTTYRVGLGLTAPGASSTRVSARLELEDNAFRGSLSIRSTLPSRGQVEYRQSLHTASAQLAASTSGATGQSGRYNGRATADIDPGSPQPIQDLSLRVGLDGRRGGLSGGLYTSLAGAADGRIELQANTGLLFAGSGISFSEIPGDSSFVIIQIPGDSVLEQVTARAGGQRTVAYSGATGSRVLFADQAFSSVGLTLRPEEMPLGYEIDASSLSVATGLRTGSLVRPRVGGSVFARGILRSPTGEPLALAAAEATDETTGEVVALLFTNRDGRFELGGLAQGRSYRLRELDGLWSATLTVPDGVAGFYDSGTLEVETTP